MTNDLYEGSRKRYSRRTVVGTGAKLAYAAPLIAASFKLNAHGALAAVCPPGFTLIEDAEPGSECCACDCTTIIAVLDPINLTCTSPKIGDVTQYCLACVSSVQSIS